MAKNNKKKKRKINFAHDAWWFIHNHPAFRLRWRTLVEEGTEISTSRIIVEAEDGVRYWEERHMHRRALDDIGRNISYVLVNKDGTTDDEDVNRKYTEVWLEFGPISYRADWEIESNRLRKIECEEKGYKYWESEITPDMYVDILHIHDWHLDCGAPTFDEALVKLANNILKHYGDYENDDNEHTTCGGKEVCLDCAAVDEMITRLGLRKKDN